MNHIKGFNWSFFAVQGLKHFSTLVEEEAEK